MSAKAARAAYLFLRRTAFHDIPLPGYIQIKTRKLRKYYGYYYVSPHMIEVDSGITDPILLLKTVAHEMVHASLEQAAACDHHKHDENFNQLAKIVCERMKWPLRGF